MHRTTKNLPAEVKSYDLAFVIKNLKILRMCVVTLAATCLPVVSSAYQIYMDAEDSAFRVKHGEWQLDRTGSCQGYYRFSKAGPGTGAAAVAWDIDAIPDGTYDVEFFVDDGDYSPAAEYIVEHDGGVTTVTKSQQFVGAGWHKIGTFIFTGAGRITQTDNGLPDGKKVIADALRITRHGTPPLPDPAVSVPPAVSIVVDDLGSVDPRNPGNPIHTLFNRAPQITYAVLPFMANSSAVLQAADAMGIETMLHQPFEYMGQSEPCNLEQNPSCLFVCMTPPQIAATLGRSLKSQEPYIWGLNNHQGSRFSQHKPGLEVVMRELKDRDFYFLDSRTRGDSLGYDIAREAGILTAERDLFVDQSAAASATVFTAEELVESVGQRAMYAPNYNHVLICHPRKTTVPGLLSALDSLEKRGIEIRRLDHNLHYIVETDHLPEGASVELYGAWTSTTRDMISHECHDGEAVEAANSTTASAVFRPNLPKAGMYRVFIATGGSPTVNAASVSVTHNNSTTVAGIIPQGANRNRWIYLDSYPFSAGTEGAVIIETTPTVGGTATADAVKFVYDGEIDASTNLNLEDND